MHEFFQESQLTSLVVRFPRNRNSKSISTSKRPIRSSVKHSIINHGAHGLSKYIAVNIIIFQQRRHRHAWMPMLITSNTSYMNHFSHHVLVRKVDFFFLTYCLYLVILFSSCYASTLSFKARRLGRIRAWYCVPPEGWYGAINTIWSPFPTTKVHTYAHFGKYFYCWFSRGEEGKRERRWIMLSNVWQSSCKLVI